MTASMQRFLFSATKFLFRQNLKCPVILNGSQYRLASDAAKASIDESPSARNWTTRCQLAACYRILNKLDFDEGICNHLSALCPAKDGSEEIMLVIPYGLSWADVTASSLVGMSLKDPRNPTVLEKGSCNLDPDISAVCIHNGIYHSRSGINCVLHTHVPNITALTCLKDQRLIMCHQNSTRFLGEICYDNEYDGMALAIDEGFRLGNIFGKKSVMMLGNHGVIVLGATIAKAFDDMYYLERAAEVQILAMSTGKELSIIPESLAKRNKEFMDTTLTDYAGMHFQAMCRRIKNEMPDYES